MLYAEWTDARPTDPDGRALIVTVAYRDDALQDEKTGADLIVASGSFQVDPSSGSKAQLHAMLRQMIVARGREVKASRGMAAELLADVPTGTKIAIP